MKTFLKKHLNRTVIIPLLVGAGLGVGAMYAVRLHAAAADTTHPVRDKNDDYTFIDPLLFYNQPSNPNAYKNVLASMQKRIDAFTAADSGGAASVYLKNLTDGTWAGINTSEQYNPASLLKVSVMFAYFKEAESDASVLDKRLTYTQAVRDSYTDIPYQQGTDLALDQSYTVQDLINKMVISSDNGATYTLLASIDQDDLSDVFNTLGIQNPVDQGRAYTISATQYSYFFRVLYNATYLNRDMSEKALELLSKSDFADGLVAGMPAGTVVAHKFGENAVTAPDGSVTQVELHDCGIVYYPADAPYLLCVMTRGADLDDLKSLIKDISALAYADKQKP